MNVTDAVAYAVTVELQLDDDRTVVPNVYMLGAATWPGHGVNGGSGTIVARKLLKESPPVQARATFDMDLISAPGGAVIR